MPACSSKSSSPRWISTELRDSSLIPSPGWRASRAEVRGATIARAEGITPMVIRPRRLLAGADQLLLERVAIRQDPLRPGQHPLAFRRQPLEPVAPLDHQDAQILLEMAQARGEGRLGHAAGLGGPREMLLAREGHEIAELADVHCRPCCARRAAPYIRLGKEYPATERSVAWRPPP